MVSLNVVKKSGENLLEATDKIMSLLATAKQSKILPENLTISITNDQSEQTRDQLSNLENSIIFGVILVVLVLLFFLGCVTLYLSVWLYHYLCLSVLWC